MISIANELKKLNELKEQGVLTQEEFETQKQKLLNPSEKFVEEIAEPEEVKTESTVVNDQRRPKIGFVAAIWNFVVPGAGYIYCGKLWYGLAAMSAVAVAILAFQSFAVAGLLNLFFIAHCIYLTGEFNKKHASELAISKAENSKRKYFFGAVLAVACVFALYMAYQDYERDIVQDSVKELMSKKLSEGDLSKYGLSVSKIVAVHESGNVYKGFATVLMDGKEHSVSMRITYDGTNVMYQVDDGQLGFIAEKAMSDAVQPAPGQ